MRTKYPNKVPIVVEPITGGNVAFVLDKKKYLVPNNRTLGWFMAYLRRYHITKLQEGDGLYTVVGNTIPGSNCVLGELLNTHGDEDGLLQLEIHLESCFG